VYEIRPRTGSARVRVECIERSIRGGRVRETPGSDASGTLPDVEGEAPGLVALRSGGLALSCLERRPDGNGSALVVRRTTPNGAGWSPPVEVASWPVRPHLANGRLVQTSRGRLLVPVVRCEAGDCADTSRARVVCHLSDDDGSSWREGAPLRVEPASAPAVAETRDGNLLMVLRSGTGLARCLSSDAGETWSDPVPIGAGGVGLAHALVRFGAGQLALAWTQAADTALASPALQGLELSLSSDAGATWIPSHAFVQRLGRAPMDPVLAGRKDALEALCGWRSGQRPSLACFAYDANDIAHGMHLPDAEHARGRYSLDCGAACHSLRLITAHTLGRSKRARRLFVESYYMRALVAAHEALSDSESAEEGWPNTRAGLDRAIAFADSLLGQQTHKGYWDLGYQDRYFADMGAAVALFAALEPHVDAERLARYLHADERFVHGLEDEHMFLASGALGVGWSAVVDPMTPGRARQYLPYMVSTALIGVEMRAWMYHRTDRADYREGALGSLAWTLSQLQPDGSILDITGKKVAWDDVGYVEEGWMAAERWIGGDELRGRLRGALAPHVAWLLRTQAPDGTWNRESVTGFARSPSILDFLIWYDQRCESREDIRRAIRRAGAVFLDPERWDDCGLFRKGDHNEVLRALAGRPLAALVREKCVY
jgi:hypothetical protein